MQFTRVRPVPAWPGLMIGLGPVRPVAVCLSGQHSVQSFPSYVQSSDQEQPRPGAGDIQTIFHLMEVERKLTI